jgi:hypothetical protein
LTSKGEAGGEADNALQKFRSKTHFVFLCDQLAWGYLDF